MSRPLSCTGAQLRPCPCPGLSYAPPLCQGYHLASVLRRSSATPLPSCQGLYMPLPSNLGFDAPPALAKFCFTPALMPKFCYAPALVPGLNLAVGSQLLRISSTPGLDITRHGRFGWGEIIANSQVSPSPRKAKRTDATPNCCTAFPPTAQHGWHMVAKYCSRLYQKICPLSSVVLGLNLSEHLHLILIVST